MTTFTEYSRKQHELPSDILLGELLWYSISESSRVDYDDLKDALDRNQLTKFCPRATAPSDVFRRVTPNGHRKRVSTTNDQIHVNYLIRPVKQAAGVCTKHIVAETVDASGERLDYEEVFALSYDTKADLFTSQPIGPLDYVAEDMARSIRLEFDANRKLVDAGAIRGILYRVLEETRAIAVRPNGGVYFIMSDHVPLIRHLESFMRTVPLATMHTLPLVDDGKQRNMLKEAYESETVGEVEKILGEAAELLGSNTTLTSDQYAKINARFSKLRTKNHEYMELLESNLDSASTKLDLLQRQMVALLGKVDA